jgi:hypothetical protein
MNTIDKSKVIRLRRTKGKSKKWQSKNWWKDFSYEVTPNNQAPMKSQISNYKRGEGEIVALTYSNFRIQTAVFIKSPAALMTASAPS